jgi:LytTr DNA-binding domain-containing protein
LHDGPQRGWVVPVVLEGSSWLALVMSLWLAWTAYRLAPFSVRPRWKLAVHLPAALLFSLAHVLGFVGIREVLFGLGGSDYQYGLSVSHFGYELSKDVLAYALFIGTCSLIDHLLDRKEATGTPAHGTTFDISDGAKLTRVRLEQIVAIQSAGNYVEFVLDDERRYLMRSSLSAIERDLDARGFVRTHRSWLVNSGKLTGLKPAGSGDYMLEFGSVSVPMSRRFSQNLDRLRPR